MCLCLNKPYNHYNKQTYANSISAAKVVQIFGVCKCLCDLLQIL